MEGQNVYINHHDHDVEDQIVAVRSDNAWTLLRVVDSGPDGWDNSIRVTDDGAVHTSSVDPSGFGGRGVEYARTMNLDPILNQSSGMRDGRRLLG